MSSINNGLPNGNKEIHKKSLKWLSNRIHIPKFIVNQFRTTEEAEARNLMPSQFDNLDTVFSILKSRLVDIKNILSANQDAIDRNSIRIDELDSKKNNKISFLAYSDLYTNPDEISNPVLKKSLDVNTKHVGGIIADEDSGIEFTEHVENDVSYIKVNLEDSKINGIKFVTDSSVKINWNEQLKAYEVLQNDIFQYDSQSPESEITITHNLGTRALDIKVFKFDPQDIELRYPIMVGMEYPSDNQVKIFLTSSQYISVLITRI